MARETGVVLKTHGNRCTVLTPQGEFRTIPRNRGPVMVGQEVEFAWPATQTNWRLLLAAASLFVVLVAGTLFTSIFPAAGYVSVDINPSIELGMNAWGRVVQAQGLNSDGKNVLQTLQLYGRPLDQALDSITQRAVAMHFLKAGDPDNLMVVTYTPGRLIRLHQEEQAYQDLADQLKAQDTPARLLFAETTPAQRYEARKLGLSPGKYLVQERLQKKGVKVTAQQMAQTSIAKLLLMEKLRLDSIMGPNTTYREVNPPPRASSGRTGSGMTANPNTRGKTVTPSGHQLQRLRATAVQPPAPAGLWERLRERLDARAFKVPGGSGMDKSRATGPSLPSGGLVTPGGSADRDNPGLDKSGRQGYRPQAGQGRLGVHPGQEKAPSGTGRDAGNQTMP